ncbi:DUF2267 domain-containing protein, partial [Streptomyces hirsutus]|uniref:DUF2267 domain-containing protein n=1 Tax=Streptomyces hirsutus TaxID=35620 RepID=UPI0033D88BC4
MSDHGNLHGAYDFFHSAQKAGVTPIIGIEAYVDLAAGLPHEAAAILTSETPATEPLTGWGFVEDLSGRTGGTTATTRWDTGTVLRVVAQLAGEKLLDRVLTRLPTGYALLFGRAELTRAA